MSPLMVSCSRIRASFLLPLRKTKLATPVPNEVNESGKIVGSIYAERRCGFEDMIVAAIRNLRCFGNIVICRNATKRPKHTDLSRQGSNTLFRASEKWLMHSSRNTSINRYTLHSICSDSFENSVCAFTQRLL